MSKSFSDSGPGDIAAVVDANEVSSPVLDGELAALTVATILRQDNHRSLEAFSDADIEAVEAALFYKKDKPYLKCLATGKDRAAKPEEIVRQAWIARLLNYYQYPISRLGIEFPITFGRDTSKR